MKKSLPPTALAFTLAAVATLSAGSAFAQAFASANATTRIVAAVSLTKTADLNFGDVVPSASLGTVVMSSSGARSATGGATLGNSGSAAAAAFSVSGASGATYAITLPSSPIMIADSGVHSMTVDTWTGSKATGTLSSGSDTFAVGGTLHVAANQYAASYNGTFTVSVNYN